MPDSTIDNYRIIMHLENVEELVTQISDAVFEWVETTTDCEETAELVHSDIDEMIIEAANNFIWKKEIPNLIVLDKEEETFDAKEIPLYDVNKSKF